MIFWIGKTKNSHFYFLAFFPPCNFSALPVPLAAEQVIWGARWWHWLRRSFSSSQQIHDKVWSGQIRPAVISEQRHRPAIHRLWNPSVSGGMLESAYKRWTQNYNPGGIIPVVQKPRGQLLPRRPRLHFSCQILIWAEILSHHIKRKKNPPKKPTHTTGFRMCVPLFTIDLTIECDNIQQHSTLPLVGGPLQLRRGEDADCWRWVLQSGQQLALA